MSGFEIGASNQFSSSVGKNYRTLHGEIFEGNRRSFKLGNAIPRSLLRASLHQPSEYFPATFIAPIFQRRAAKEAVVDRHTTGRTTVLPCYDQHHCLQHSFLPVGLNFLTLVHVSAPLWSSENRRNAICFFFNRQRIERPGRCATAADRGE